MSEERQGNIIIYQSEDGNTKIDVRLENENIWLTQKMMAELFQTTPQNITIHLKNIFEEAELQENSTCKDFLQVQIEGSRQVERKQKFYNLDMIISLGYRIKSHIATKFRIWATERLKEYIIKGFTMDDERLKGTGGGNYWKELLDRIRDIRSSEKVIYRQVLDLYATSIDYDPKTPESIQFFKVVQNKLHYAVNKQTAAETVYSRVNAEKDFMGLTNFLGQIPIKQDVRIAKNYLNSDELFRLSRMVSAFFDLAEIKAHEHTKMQMKDWVDELDRFTTIYGKGTLENAGNTSHNKAMKKATEEYLKYQKKTISPVEKDYLDTVKTLEQAISKKRAKHE